MEQRGSVVKRYEAEMFSFEAAFDADFGVRFMNEFKFVSVVCSIIYVLLIFAGRRVMADRVPFTIRGPLVMWNIALATFSIFGAVRTVPELVHGIIHNSWTHSVCDISYYGGQTGLWVFLFTLSKIVELGDTAFIVLRKQPLQFLHWYHHFTVMIYCFYSYPLVVASGRWYMVMNYCVHSAMYTYYTLKVTWCAVVLDALRFSTIKKAMRIALPRPVSVVITSLQIMQMCTGLIVVAYVAIIKMTTNIDCNQSFNNIAATVAMYISYLMLFIQFFYHAYAAPKASRKHADKEPRTAVENGVKKIN